MSFSLFEMNSELVIERENIRRFIPHDPIPATKISFIIYRGFY